MSDNFLVKQGDKAEWGVPEGYPKKSGWSIEWDGNTEGLVPVFDAYFKVSDLVPTDDELIGSIVELSNGQKIELTSDSFAVFEDFTSADGDFVVVKKDNATTSDGITLPQKGTYFIRYNGTYTTKLSKQTITPMAEEFLPTGIKELIMSSSTIDSTKKFKITVDDSGTISATEVT